jgi:hypothetical protein
MWKSSGSKLFAAALAMAGALTICGCKSIGPGTVARDRSDYSSSISESWKRQTLLNIVKLRYLDPPIFIDVGQIVAGYSLETSVSAGGEFSSLDGNKAMVGGTARYTDRPTITYMPLTGNQFVKAMMTPLPPESVFFTIQSGWPAEAVLIAAAASINGLKNQEASIAGVTSADPKFLRVIELLRNLQRSGTVSFRVKQDSKSRQRSLLTLRSKDASPQTLEEARELRQLLQVNSETSEFDLVFGSLPANDKEVCIITRSIMHILSTIAAQVEVPLKDMEEGRATPGARESTAGQETGGWLVIQSSKSKPANAFVSAPYRNSWFWIDDRDLKSKRAFAFMMMLFTLADTGQKEGMPLITIPAQ